jgi:hypothetical protein
MPQKKKFNVARMKHYAGRLMSAMDGGYGYFSVDADHLWPTAYVMLFRTPRYGNRCKDSPAAIATRLFGGAWKSRFEVDTAQCGNGLTVRSKYQKNGAEVLVAIGSEQSTARAMK